MILKKVCIIFCLSAVEIVDVIVESELEAVLLSANLADPLVEVLPLIESTAELRDRTNSLGNSSLTALSLISTVRNWLASTSVSSSLVSVFTKTFLVLNLFFFSSSVKALETHALKSRAFPVSF